MPALSNFKIAVTVVLAALVVGAFNLGLELGERRGLELAAVPETLNGADFTPFWTAWGILNERFVQASTTAATTTDQEKVWGAIKGLTDSFGDPYTVFLPPEEKELFEDDIRGNFGGVGIEIGIRNDVLTVVAPLPNTPAERAGVRAGDKIIKVNDLLTADLSTDEAVKEIRGEVGTKVKLTLIRNGGAPFEVNLTREIITIPTIDTELLPSGVFVIRVYNFSAQSSNLFRQALRDFVKAKTDKLVIDLRNNPGGYLESAVDMASWFLPVGKVVVTEDRRGHGESEVYRSRGYDIFNNKLKLVILVNSGSASASEILAGALKEHGKALLVGEKTFGKGSVQELVPITDDSSLKITVARWLTPQGTSFSAGGLAPDVTVKLTEEDIKTGRDPQLDKAVEVLLNMKK